MPLPAPDPTGLHPVAGRDGTVVLRPLVQNMKVDVDAYAYDDSVGDPFAFWRSRRRRALMAWRACRMPCPDRLL
jgi:hypothetical protein